MAPMSTRRKHLGCAVFNNMIYAGKMLRIIIYNFDIRMTLIFL